MLHPKIKAAIQACVDCHCSENNPDKKKEEKPDPYKVKKDK